MVQGSSLSYVTTIRRYLLQNRHYTSDPPPWHRLRYRVSTTVRSVADKMEERSPVSVAEAVGKLVFVAAAFVAIFVLYVFLADKPFGIQIATIITYTGSIFCLVFFRWRWLNEAYSLRTKQVRQQLPRLMAIHLAFLLSILVVLTAGLLARPRLPNYWVVERGAKHETLFVDALGLFCIVAGVTQVFISRSILRRSLDVEKDQPEIKH